MQVPQKTSQERKIYFQSYSSTMSHFIDYETPCHREAMGEKVWKDAIEKEYQYILKNYVWDTNQRLEGNSMTTSKWIYKIKHETYGRDEKYKARSIARGFSQEEGVKYDETY
jgi:hypothetical protein